MSVANSSNITTIQILRSYSNTTPTTLDDGQLAYSFVSNTLYIGSNTGIQIIGDPSTAVKSQAAYDQANTATVLANGAYFHANGAFLKANAGYDQANTGTVLAQAAFDKANTGGVITGNVYISNDLSVANTITTNTLNISTNTSNVSLTKGIGITSWNYSGKFKSIATEESNPAGLFISPDGLNMYVNGTTGDDVNQYTLSSAWNVSTATYVRTFSTASQDSAPNDIFFKPDGLTMFIMGGTNDRVFQYDLTIAWNISTASYTSKFFSVTSQESLPTGLWFKPDGTVMYVIGTTNDTVYQYDLGTAWDVSTASYASISFSVASQETSPQQINLSADGTKMWILGTTNDDINEYNLGTAWNVSTATFVNNFYVGFQDAVPQGLFIDSTANDRVYIVGSANDAVFQYNRVTNSINITTDVLTVNNNARIQGNLAVQSSAYVDGSATISGALSVGGSTSLSTTSISGTLSGSGGVLLDGSATNTIRISGSQTTGNLFIGGATQTGNITFGYSSVNQTANIANGTTAAGSTKVVNLGTSAGSGSNTQINIGPSTAGANGNVTFNPATTVAIQNTRASTSNTTGALTVLGGLGVSGNVYAAGLYDGGVEVLSYLQGVDNTQNTRLTVIEGTNLSQNVRLDFSNSRMTIIEGVDVGQNTRMVVIEGVDLSQNVRLNFSNTRMDISDGVNASQNVRLDYSNTALTIAQGVDNSQNVRLDFSNTAITIIQGVDVGQNSRMTIIEGVDVGQNSRMTIIEGVDVTQNTNISTVTVLAQAAFNRANTEPDSFSYLANTVVVANSTGYLSNSNVFFTSSNNNLIVSGNVQVSNGSITTPAKELTLGVTGDTFGAQYLRLQNRVNQNGPLFDGTSSSVALVDFGFKTVNGQRNIRYETRGGAEKYISSGDGLEFQIGEAANPTLVTSNNSVLVRKTTGSTSTTTGALVVNGGVGIAGNVYSGMHYITGSGNGIVFVDSTVQTTAGSSVANTVYLQGVDNSQNVRIDFSNTALTVAQGVDNSQNVRIDFSNTRMTISEGVDLSQNVRLDFSNTAITIIQGVDVTQNTRLTVSEGVDLSQNVRLDFSNTRMNIIDGVNAGQNARMTIIEGVDVTQNTNIANRLALSGVSLQTVTGNVVFGNDVTVTGNLVILGNTISLNVTSLEVEDTLIQLGIGNYYTDALTIGYVGHYNDGTNAHAGMIRDAVTKEFYAFQGYTPEVTGNVINVNAASFTKANIHGNWFKGNLIATTARVGGLDVNSRLDFSNTRMAIIEGVDVTQNTNIAATDGKMQSAYNVANTADVRSVAAYFHANGAFIKANAAFDSVNVQIGVDTTQNTRMLVIEGTDLSQNVSINTQNSFITIIQGVDVGQNSRMLVIEGTNLSQNVRLDFSNSRMTIIEGVDVTQNTRLTVSEGVDLSQNVRLDFSNTRMNIIDGVDAGQNARMTIIEGVDVTQNTRLTVSEGVDLSQNVSINTQNSFITIIQGVDVGQNARMTISEGVDLSQNVRLDYSNTALTIAQGVDNSQNVRLDYSNTVINQIQSAWTPNTVIVANSAGFLSNSEIFFTSSNNRFIAPSTIFRGSVNLNNNDLGSAGTISFADPGPDGRIDFGQWKIWDSPNDFSNVSGSLQFIWNANTSSFNTSLATGARQATLSPNGQFSLSNTIPSTSNTTGTLVVTGGVGISGNTFLNNSLAAITTTPAAVNYIQVSGNTTGNAPTISVQGSDTNIDLNLTPKGTGVVAVVPSAGWVPGQVARINLGDSGSNLKSTASTGKATLSGFDGVEISSRGASPILQLNVAHTASAVNYLQVSGAATGGAPYLLANGSDTNVPLILSSKGAGSILFKTAGTTPTQFLVAHTASADRYLQASGGQSGVSSPSIGIGGGGSAFDLYTASGGNFNFYTNGNGSARQFVVAHTASAVNYVQVTGATTGLHPSVSATGSDADVRLNIFSKGSGSVDILTNNGGVRQGRFSHTANAINYLEITGSVTGSGSSLSAQGSDTNVGININPKGAGSVNVTSTTSSTSNTSGALIVNGGLGLSGNLTMSIVPNVGRLTLSPTHFIYNDSAGIVFTGSNYYYFNNTGGVYNQTALIQRGPIYNDVGNTTVLFAGTSQVKIQNGTASSNTTTGALVVQGGVGISGALNATTKSFNIPHPTKVGKDLRYGSLEGPEFGVYVRGTLKGSNIIELPDYWTKLVDANTITVSLTSIGKHQKLSVKEVKDNTIIINSDGWFKKEIHCYYVVYGERADVDKLDVEG